MRKRLNPYRRAAKIAEQVRLQARSMTVAYNAETDAKLQQGRVRSPLNTMFNVGFHAPKSVVPAAENMSSRSEGQPGKVQRGKLKYKRLEPAKAPAKLRDWRGMTKR